MINIDDVPLLFTYPVVTQGVQSGYLDETHVLVYVPSSNSFTLVGEDLQGNLIMLTAIVRDYLPKAWNNINFGFFIGLLDKCQGLDATHFLSMCQSNGWSVAEGFDEVVDYLRKECKATCKHFMVRSSGDCMVCDALQPAFLTPIQLPLSFNFSPLPFGSPFAPDEEVTPRIDTTPAISVKDQRKKDGLCPECGDRGEWRGLGLVCKNGHGVFIGG